MESTALKNFIRKRDPTTHTIDKKHSQMLEHFNKIDTEIIPQLRQEVDEIKHAVAEIAETAFSRRHKIFYWLLMKYFACWRLNL